MSSLSSPLSLLELLLALPPDLAAPLAAAAPLLLEDAEPATLAPAPEAAALLAAPCPADEESLSLPLSLLSSEPESSLEAAVVALAALVVALAPELALPDALADELPLDFEETAELSLLSSLPESDPESSVVAAWVVAFAALVVAFAPVAFELLLLLLLPPDVALPLADAPPLDDELESPLSVVLSPEPLSSVVAFAALVVAFALLTEATAGFNSFCSEAEPLSLSLPLSSELAAAAAAAGFFVTLTRRAAEEDFLVVAVEAAAESSEPESSPESLESEEDAEPLELLAPPETTAFWPDFEELDVDMPDWAEHCCRH